MHPAIAYLLKMFLCSAILLGYYWVALRNERFHQWNRFYLLAAMLLSIGIPFIQIPLMAEEEPTMVVSMVAAMPWNHTVTVTPIFWTWKNIILFSLAIVSSLLLIQLVAGIIRIILLYKSQPHTFFKEVSVVITEEQTAPFSFFKWLFWRGDIDPDSANGQQILRHELTHINEKHSADKLFTELLLIVFWMNPFFWLMRKELFAIHEFLADRKAIASQDGAAFAAMILQAVQHEDTPALANPFFTSHLKRRLIMITRSTAPKYSYLRRISGFLLMILTGISLVLSIENAMAQKAPPPPPKKTVAPPPPPNGQWAELPDSIKAAEVIDKNGVCYIKYTMKDGRKFTYELKQAQKKGYFIPPPPPPSPLSPPAPPAPVSALSPVSPEARVSIVDTVTGVKLADPVKPLTLKLSKSDNPEMQPVIIYAGAEISNEQLQQVNPADIESINVVKDASLVGLVEKYGEKARNGVIFINPKIGKSNHLQEVVVTGYPIAKTGQADIVVGGDAKTNPPVAANGPKEIVVVGYGKTQAPKNDKVFTATEQAPLFPGGHEAWRKYLERNISYPYQAQNNGTQGAVNVQFTVDTEGNISDVKALNDPGNGLAEEAVRLIKKGPNWVPAEQNGKKVAARTTQLITFRLE
ncbi:MAG TPA: TonB family protein [Phnomibacter sp.]|nr:TonB family protein [Phnomibacter sp.]